MNEPLLIVSASGRMLAHSAHRAGYKPLVIDLFADRDTQDVSVAVQKVASLASEEVLPVVGWFQQRFGVRDVVYGSGLETFPETLALINEHFNVIGNSYQTFQRILDKRGFFRSLNNLQIPFPQVQFHVPDTVGCWLVKPLAGEGGVDISWWQPEAQCAYKYVNKYWQQHVEGVSMSALFLADGVRAKIIGFNQQWTEPDSFVFSGIMTVPDADSDLKSRVQHWLTKLVPKFDLRGVNSLDFIDAEDRCQVLEINPRPSASMMLYDDGFDSGLLKVHLNACHGRIDQEGRYDERINACQVLYADTDYYLATNVEWPEWCLDRPCGPGIIAKGQPVCSIVARGVKSSQVLQKLANRRQIIFNLIEGKN